MNQLNTSSQNNPPTSLLSHDKIERLLFIRFLLSQADIQRTLGRPKSSVAILTLHDLTECFLQLGFEILCNRSKINGNNILDVYSEEINKILVEQGNSTINKAFIKRLNELRNQLKHSSIFIDHRNIENLFSETETFVTDFTQIFFNISLESVSIVRLISNDEIRTHLLEAETSISQKDYHLAMISIAKSFYEYEKLETEIKDQRGYNLVRPYRRSDFTIRFSAMFNPPKIDPAITRSLQDIAKDLNNIKDELLSIRQTQLLSLDIKGYLLFTDLIPYVRKHYEREGENEVIKFFVPHANRLTKDSYSLEQVKFCFDFAVDAVLKSNR